MKLCRTFAAATLALTVGACSAALPSAAFDDTTPVFKPEIFFAGATRSTGVQEDRAGAPTRLFQVAGQGILQPDGDLQLDQTIVFDQDPPLQRTWIMHRTDDHHFTASLTGADGPVTGENYGNLVHLTYAMVKPRFAQMEQWLYLQPDGVTVVNEATVSFLGITAARLSERITREK